MSVATDVIFDFDDSFVRDLTGMYEPWRPTPVRAPELVVLNEALAAELGTDTSALRSDDGVALLAGNAVADGSTPVAQAYAGHQFGGFSPRLGDGRALLLGELHDIHGRRRDLHLKGSGRTPFARGGDGRAALGPMLREYIIGEAMHALDVPTTRALAVVATGEQVARDTMLPGAVLARIASSHLRVGTFQYAATQTDTGSVQRLADYAIARHRPEAAAATNPYLAFFDGVVDAQAALVARWMLVGFIHGVMNTDNMTISGETIDYGPCAFMDAYDPATVFSSIDHGGRYAYGNQPQIAQWDLARLAETLLPLFAVDTDAAVETATEVLKSFPDRFRTYWSDGMRAKLGIVGERDGDGDLIDDVLAILHTHQVDFTSFFRALSAAVLERADTVRSLFDQPADFDLWSIRWQDRMAETTDGRRAAAASMDRVNPIYIPRNHQVERVLDAAIGGDLAPFERLLGVLARPFDERSGLEQFASPAPPDFGPYRTFCGT